MTVSRNRSVTQDLIDLVYEKINEIPDPRPRKGEALKLVSFAISGNKLMARGYFAGNCGGASIDVNELTRSKLRGVNVRLG